MPSSPITRENFMNTKTYDLPKASENSLTGESRLKIYAS